MLDIVYPIKVREITLDRLKKGEFQNAFPEVYALKNVVENNAWHDNESVFDHTMNVLYMLEQIKKYCSKRVKNYLEQTLDDNTQWETLYVGGLLHDRGKESTLKNTQSGTTCPGHEGKGAKIISSTLNKIFLSDLEQRIVKKIVEYHGHPNNIIHPNNENLEEQYDKLMSQQSDISVELNILALADTLSSKPLRINNPKEFKMRTGFYMHILDMY